MSITRDEQDAELQRRARALVATLPVHPTSVAVLLGRAIHMCGQLGIPLEQLHEHLDELWPIWSLLGEAYAGATRDDA